MLEGKKTLRVLIAKPGLDGHDRGAKVMAKALMDAGMEVIYTGLHQRVETIVTAASDEDVDILGLSILSGAHLGYTRKIIAGLRQAGAQDIKVLVGGNIPAQDIPLLLEMGAENVFSGSSPQEVIDYINKFINSKDLIADGVR